MRVLAEDAEEFAEFAVLFKRVSHPEPGRQKMIVLLISVSWPVSKGWEARAMVPAYAKALDGQATRYARVYIDG